MAKDSNTAKAAPKKPPAAAPKQANEVAEVKGKIVRKDQLADKAPQTGAAKPAETKPVKHGGKIVRKDTPAPGATVPFGGATVGFEDPAVAEAAAEEVLLGGEEEADNTQGFLSDTFDSEPATSPDENDAPAGSTQAFMGDTLKSAIPKIVAEEVPIDNNTGDFINQTIDSEMPKE